MSILAKLRMGLAKTSDALKSKLQGFSSKRIDKATLQSIEEALISSDLGSDTSSAIVENIKKLKFDKAISENEISEAVQQEILLILKDKERSFDFSDRNVTHIIMMCGINGSGKTTTSGKLAMRFSKSQHKVALIGCDTFRSAAYEQLEIWAKRADCLFFSGEHGSDPASAAFDGIQKATDAKCNVIIVDTAGRLQNNKNLMDEINKCYKSIVKSCEKAKIIHKIENILVLDATIGQNAFSQVCLFDKSISLSGLIITKLDGTAKGGVVVALSEKYKLPIYCVGIGEKVEDLSDFSAEIFAKAII